MFFISENELDTDMLYPRIPINYFTENGFEDNRTSRVCFCPTVDKCLTALGYNCMNTEFYVYKPIISYDELLEMGVIHIPNSNQVPDADYTNEIWCLEPVRLKLVGKIYCKDAKNGSEHAHKFHFGNESSYVYDWDFKWL